MILGEAAPLAKGSYQRGSKLRTVSLQHPSSWGNEYRDSEWRTETLTALPTALPKSLVEKKQSSEQGALGALQGFAHTHPQLTSGCHLSLEVSPTLCPACMY